MKILFRLARLTSCLFVAVAFFAPSVFADYTVAGKFQYQDREFDILGFTGALIPRAIRFADVRIMAGSVTLATGATDIDGNFSIVVPGTTAQAISAVCVTRATVTPGLLLDVRVANSDYTFGDFYSVSSAGVDSPGFGFIQLETTIALANTDPGKAFNLWDVIVDGLEFVASSGANGSLPTEKLTVIWRQTHPRTGSFFSGGSTKFIYMGANAAYDDTIASHEFGHFVDRVFSKSDSPGGTHFLGDNNQDIRLSWGEGLATFLGSSIRDFKRYPRPDIYVNTDGNNLSFSYEIELLTRGSATLASRTGSTNEVAVTAALWDIIDGTGTADGTTGDDDDNLQRPFAEVWRNLTRYFPSVGMPGISIEDFWDGWFSPTVNNGFAPEMRKIFATLNGIEFVADAFELDNDNVAARLTGAAVLPALASGPRVLINEIDVGSVDALELYNAGSEEADLTGWKVESSAPGFNTATFLISTFRLPPGSFVILSEASGVNTDSILYFGRNISWSNGAAGACALIDAKGTGVDFVRWGGSSEAPLVGTTFVGADPPSPASEKSLGRNFAGADRDSGSDWSEQNPTFGTFNFSGQEKHHTFYGTGDADFAALSATAGARYRVETMNLLNGAHTVLDVLSTDGATVLATSSGSGKSSRLDWTAPSTGRFYIRSRRFDGPANFAQYGSYDLRVTEINAQPFQWTSIFPQIAAGGGYRTSIIGINTGAVPAAVNVSLTKSDGSPFPVTVLNQSGSFLSLFLPPGGISRLDSTSSGNTTSGYAKLLSSIPVTGTTLFQTFNGNTIISEAGVGLSQPTKKFTLYVDNLNQAHSGYAIANFGDTPAQLTLTVRSRSGLSLEAKSLMLPVGQHIAEFAFQRFPVTASAGFEGSIEVTSDQSVAAIALRFDNPDYDVFSTIPVLVDEGGTTVYFAQVADGSGYRTNFILMNPSGMPASVKLEFFASDGTPLSLPIGGTLKASHDVPLSAKGVARFITDGTSSVIKTGWVRVTSPVAIGGSSIFQTVSGGRIRSEAGVASSPLATRFTTYVESVGFAESGLAICNPTAANVTLNLKLRNAAGEVVATTDLILPPFGQTAGFFTRWFPSGFEEFEGTLEVLASDPVGAVALRFDNHAADVFATLPVVIF